LRRPYLVGDLFEHIGGDLLSLYRQDTVHLLCSGGLIQRGIFEEPLPFLRAIS
jgi:hypothetical protein